MAMPINLNALGLILTILGALVILLNNTLTGWHQRVYGQKLTERYWWTGRRPFYRNTLTGKLHMNWTRKVPVNGIIPPKYFWEIVGFLLILIGTLLQIIRLQLW